MNNLILCLLVLFVVPAHARVGATIPAADKQGGRDHPALKRYEGSLIVAYEHNGFDEFTFPLSRLEPVQGKRDTRNNQAFDPKQKRTREGPYTRLVYLLPANRSPLEVLRNYQQEIEGSGGEILFECKGADCGGSETRGSGGGGGSMSLAMYLYPYSRIKDPHLSAGYCAIESGISDQRYAVAELPEKGLDLSILTYTVQDSLYCKAFNGRTVAIVDIIEGKPREQKMVTVKAEEMADRISATGSIALYGIYFDFNQAKIKHESGATLKQITRLLKDSPELALLVVGHTDNAGAFSYNMDLSQRRAAAVVDALVLTYGVDRGRLMPVGVSFASPVASNQSEEGRAKNRRVELVAN